MYNLVDSLNGGKSAIYDDENQIEQDKNQELQNEKERE